MMNQQNDRQVRRRVLEFSGPDDKPTPPAPNTPQLQHSLPRRSDSEPQANDADNSAASFATTIANCGGHVIRFLGDEDQFYRSIRGLGGSAGHQAQSGKQVCTLEPIDFYGLPPTNIIGGFVARLQDFLQERHDLLGRCDRESWQNLTRLFHANTQSLGVMNGAQLDTDAYATASLNQTRSELAMPRFFKQTVEKVLAPGVLVVQPIIGLEYEQTQIPPTLRAIKNTRADNLVWLIVLPELDHSYLDADLSRLTSGTIHPE
jgi:hypothetical protein